jgi:DNA repair protein RadC
MQTQTNTSQTGLAEITLAYKSKIPSSLKPKVTSSKDAHHLLLASWDASKIELVEQFKVLLLNRANKVNGVFEVSSGSPTGTLVDPKLIFAASIKSHSQGIILAHNHPSGNLKPSEADISLTKRVKDVGNLLDLQVLDHLIITTEGYYSFADEGLL